MIGALAYLGKRSDTHLSILRLRIRRLGDGEMHTQQGAALHL
jgi:hypothetical protein